MLRSARWEASVCVPVCSLFFKISTHAFTALVKSSLHYHLLLPLILFFFLTYLHLFSLFPFLKNDFFTVSLPRPFLVTFEQTVFRSAAGSGGFLRSCVTSLLVFAYYMTFTYSPSAVDCFLCLSLLLLSSTLPVSSFSFTLILNHVDVNFVKI